MENYFPNETVYEEQCKRDVNDIISRVTESLVDMGFRRANYFDRKRGYQLKGRGVKVGMECSVVPDVRSGRSTVAMGVTIKVKEKGGRPISIIKPVPKELDIKTYLENFLTQDEKQY
jgi:hypothetical protein